MIDVTSKGVIKIQIEVIFHFVNKTRNPGTLPQIKRYFFGNDLPNKNNAIQQFLRDVDRLAMQESQYYRKLKQSQMSNN